MGLGQQQPQMLAGPRFADPGRAISLHGCLIMRSKEGLAFYANQIYASYGHACMVI
jgi:hypothetical protein